MCFWEDDGQHENEAAAAAGPNGITLAEGQRLYERYGSSSLIAVGQTRQPTADEQRDPGWRPQPRQDGKDDSSYFMSDFGQLLTRLTDDAQTAAQATRSDADIARFNGLSDALKLLVTQADAFAIPRDQIGVDPQLDLDRDLLLDPPRTFGFTRPDGR